MKEKMKLINNQGITLVALVVTIIVMLILAGITLRFVWGERGIIERTEKARIEHQIGEEKDILSLSHSASYIDNKAEGEEYTTEKMHDEIGRYGKDAVVNWKVSGKIMRVRFKDTLNVYTINVETGEIKYEGKYNPSIESPELKVSDLKFIHTPNVWTNGNTLVTIQKNEESNLNLEELEIQYSIGNLENWSVYTQPIEMQKNGTIYVRLSYELIGEQSQYISDNETNIDKLPPEGNIETSSKTNSINIIVNATDQEATAENGKSEIKGYYYSKDDGATYTELTTKNTYTFDQLIQNTEYKIKVKVEDIAGNITEISKNEITGSVIGLQEANLKVNCSPSGWTNGNVTATASINASIDTTDFSIQTSKDAKEWKDKTSLEFSENGRIYVRLWDGTNAGDYASVAITNIDKLPPNEFTPTATPKTSAITITASAADQEATTENGKSGVKEYRFSKDNGKNWSNYQTNGIYEFTGLTQTTTYSLKVQARDNAGNVTTGSVNATTRTVPTPTTSDLNYTTTWNGSNATVTFTTTSGTTIETSTDGINWSRTNLITVPSGTQIYVRYSDGTNASSSFAAVRPLRPGKITYHANGGNGNVPAQQNVQHTNGVTVSFSPLPTRTGYTFQGWATSASGAAIYTSGGTKTFTMGTSDVTLYAVWTINQYTISYHANGGNGAPGSQIKTYGQILTLSNTKPTRSGYAFLGWSTNNAATSATYMPGGSYTANSDVTLYAIWKQEAPATTAIQTTTYGNKVNYSANNVTDWEIFYNDGTYIYLIASDNVLVSGMNLMDQIYVKGEQYKVGAESNYVLAQWMGNTDYWTSYASGMPGAVAWGGPDTTQISNVYYQMFQKTVDIHNAGTIKGLPCAGGSFWLRGLNFEIEYCVQEDVIWGHDPYSTRLGIRPIVRLPAGIKAEKNQNGKWDFYK